MGCAASNSAKGSNALNGNNHDIGGGFDSKHLRIKLVLLGDSGVGKSCIVLRFVRGQFDPSSKVTVGASFLSQTIALQDSTTVKFEIWDTAGQERYASLAPLYYRGASAAIVVYDITSNDSFQKAQYWVKELQKHGSPNIVMALVGNKADLHDSREVLQEVSKDYADNNGMFFIETSAKTADNVNELFEATRKKGVCRDEGGTWGGRTSQGLAGANEERTVISFVCNWGVVLRGMELAGRREEGRRCRIAIGNCD